MNVMITGGAGFIGSHVVRLFVNKYPDSHIVNVDKLTYAGNLANLADIEDRPNYTFVKADICDYDEMLRIMKEHDIDGVIHLAAESHVDRSILDPFTFARTNVMGTLALLQAAKVYWESKPEGYKGKLFYHISTDEVYGALELTNPEGVESPFTTAASSQHHHAYGTEFFLETTTYNPHSPYSASKASSDHFVRAYHDTYGMPTIVTNCSNNYGPYQFPEKLIPLIINNILEGKKLPVYGEGTNVRDWLYVEDHCKAIDAVVTRGEAGSIYNVGGHNERQNIQIVKIIIRTIHDLMAERPEWRTLLKRQKKGADGQIDIDWINEDLITFVKDRLGHDQRYGIDPSKIKADLGWYPETTFEEGIVRTIRWNLENRAWVEAVSGENYQLYYDQMYGKR